MMEITLTVYELCHDWTREYSGRNLEVIGYSTLTLEAEAQGVAATIKFTSDEDREALIETLEAMREPRAWEEGALRNLSDNLEEAQEELHQCRRQLRRTRALLDCYQAHASDETDRRAQQAWEHYCDEYPDEEAT